MAALKYPFLKRREDNESQVKGSSIKACPSKRKKTLNKTIIRSEKNLNHLQFITNSQTYL